MYVCVLYVGGVGGGIGLPSHFVLSLGETSARAGPGGRDSEFSFDPSVNIYFCVQPATCCTTIVVKASRLTGNNHMPRGVQYGVKAVDLKGEDAHTTILATDEAPSSCFAVFDGHGGKRASAYGIKHLAPVLQKLGASASDDLLVNAFWDADTALGGKTTSGSTATVLLVDDADDGGSTCTLIWVGDSMGVVLEMTASAVEGEHTIIGQTTLHLPDQPAEEKRLNDTWQVSRQLRLDRQLDGKSAPAVEAVQEAAVTLGFTLNALEALVISRAIERGQCIDKFKFGAYGNIEAGMTSVMAPRVAGGKSFLHKLPTPIAPSPESSTHGGNAFSPGPSGHGANKFFEPTASKSISTACSRALGDWDGSRALVPQPEILRFRVAPGSCVRVVIASDGLWDLMTASEACVNVLARSKDADDCAYKLVNLAVSRSNARFNMLKDDTTAMVIELNPSGVPVPLTKPATSGCCTIA